MYVLKLLAYLIRDFEYNPFVQIDKIIVAKQFFI